jgi:hypothetical protein
MNARNADLWRTLRKKCAPRVRGDTHLPVTPLTQEIRNAAPIRSRKVLLLARRIY